MYNFRDVLEGRAWETLHDLQIDFDNLHLIQPCRDYLESFKQAMIEFMACGVDEFSYPKLDGGRDVRAYFKRLENYRRGRVPEGHVPSSAFWLVDGKSYLGGGDVRHYLNDNLRKLGGNIGYAIRPAAWQKGLGTLQLSLLLKEAKKLGIAKPIITCFDGNIASYKIIEKNGGILLGKVVNKIKGADRLTRIYEVELRELRTES
jgi:predicted acetyltransferase